MELKDFVAQALREIVSGVVEAQKSLAPLVPGGLRTKQKRRGLGLVAKSLGFFRVMARRNLRVA